MTKLQQAVQAIDSLMLALNCIRTTENLSADTLEKTGQLLVEVAEINKQLRDESNEPAVTY